MPAGHGIYAETGKKDLLVVQGAQVVRRLPLQWYPLPKEVVRPEPTQQTGRRAQPGTLRSYVAPSVIFWLQDVLLTSDKRWQQSPKAE